MCGYGPVGAYLCERFPAHVRSTGYDAAGAAVLTYCRWVLVRKRDAFVNALTRTLKQRHNLPVAGADRLNISGGAIEIEVTRRSNESALAKVVKMVSEAETQKSPTQRFTDRFERIFVPAVLVLSVLLLFAWVVVDEPFRDSFYRAMAVLVAASPCALAIATPSAVLSGVARAARGGVLVPVAQASDAPLMLIGVGEGVEDLQPFDARAFSRSLVGLED